MKRKAHSKITRETVFEKYAGRCAYCGCPLTLKTMQIDHIHAHYKNGSNELDNYNPACRACNFYKGALDIEQFRSLLKTIHERLSKIFIYKTALRHGIIIEMPFEKFFFEEWESGAQSE